MVPGPSGITSHVTGKCAYNTISDFHKLIVVFFTTYSVMVCKKSVTRGSDRKDLMARRRTDEGTRYPPGFAEALGRTIKVIRTDLGIERRDLAERAGISYSYITEIENGNKPPSSSVLGPIATALGLRMSQLIEAAEGRMEAQPTGSNLNALMEESALYARSDDQARVVFGEYYSMLSAFAPRAEPRHKSGCHRTRTPAAGMPQRMSSVSWTSRAAGAVGARWTWATLRRFYPLLEGTRAHPGLPDDDPRARPG
jgi:transcriptional regulator with XRE-family HTH domain